MLRLHEIVLQLRCRRGVFSIGMKAIKISSNYARKYFGYEIVYSVKIMVDQPRCDPRSIGHFTYGESLNSNLKRTLGRCLQDFFSSSFRGVVARG